MFKLLYLPILMQMASYHWVTIYSQSASCQEFNFEPESPLLFTETCAGDFLDYQYKSYDDEPMIDRPVGSNTFMTDSPGGANCMSSVTFNFVFGITFRFKTIAYHDGTGDSPLCIIQVNDTDSTPVGTSNIIFTASKEWKNTDVLLTRVGQASMELKCTNINSRNSILAIDSIKVLAFQAANCLNMFPPLPTHPPLLTTSMTTPSYETTTPIETTPTFLPDTTQTDTTMIPTDTQPIFTTESTPIGTESTPYPSTDTTTSTPQDTTPLETTFPTTTIPTTVPTTFTTIETTEVPTTTEMTTILYPTTPESGPPNHCKKIITTTVTKTIVTTVEWPNDPACQSSCKSNNEQESELA